MYRILTKISNHLLLLVFLFSTFINASPLHVQNSSQIYLSLEKLKVLGSVLYIAAHPDDENTGLLAYLSQGRKYRTAYLSLTRGDGGQNLIGSEKGSEIGIIRTQELLQARSVDGAEQYFTRSIDFGFSKSPEESLNIWGKKDVLSDIVWVIRNFKPDIIITRFPVGGNGGHGHHTASASLAEEAFVAAADSNMFPEQLKYVETWKAKRIFWNNWRAENTNQLLKIDTGEYNFLLGKSYTEISAEGRSMHKSQGFGVTASRAPRIEYFQFVDGEPANNDILDGVNTSWNRVKNGELIEQKINSIIKSYNFQDPSKSLDNLIDLYSSLNKLEHASWLEVKRNELLDIIQSCAGLWMEAISSDYSAAPGDEINIKTTLVNRSSNSLVVEKIEFPTVMLNSAVNKKLEENQPYLLESKIRIPESYSVSQPYWLSEETTRGLFTVSDQRLVGKAENPFSLPVKIYLRYNTDLLEYNIPLIYRWNDKVDGEHYRPFEVHPAVVANIAEKVAIFPSVTAKEIQIKLINTSPNTMGEIHLHADKNWEINPSIILFSFKNKYDEKVFSFKITPPKNPGNSTMDVELNVNGKIFNKSLVEILHPHIPPQVYFPDSKIKLVKLDIKKFDSRIGYVMGSGDDVPDCLINLGYKVTILSDNMLEQSDLLQFNAIIMGIRAYNTRERLKYIQPRLMDYVKNGGTLIVQYNVSSGLQTENIGPYPFKLGNGRITVEEAPLNFVNPNHQLLNFPNKITPADFDNWVQERGLYFADQWDSKYETILSGNDPNEKELAGGTLFTRYGKGVFIFSGLAWFRQLPAGVPGAYKIIVNMISAGKYNGK
jgi:LmbE family N-acetylglucosaminyl deacetylase